MCTPIHLLEMKSTAIGDTGSDGMGNDRPRVIGSLRERIKLHAKAQEVLNIMAESRRFDEDEVTSLEHVILGFLREPAPKLWGMCSYSNTHRRARNAGERTWRILINRTLLERRDDALRETLYHEFLHAILGSEEGHGPTFQRYEALWPFDECMPEVFIPNVD
jgi:hypothetical protein